MAETPVLIGGGQAFDDRGSVAFVNDLLGFNAKRMYRVRSFTAGFVRAWHGHLAESKMVYCVRGAAKVVLISVDQWGTVFPKIEQFYLADAKPQALYVPAGYYNGWMSLLPDTELLFLSDAALEESAADDYRAPARERYPEVWKVVER